MRRLITLFAVGMLSYAQASAHGWTVVRSWCGGFFHQKYQAFSDISLLTYTTYPTGYNQVGQYVGTNPKGSWSTICNSDDKGCSRPRTATCSRSGTAHDVIINGGWFQGALFNYNSYVQTVLDWSGQHVTQSNVNGRSQAGMQASYELDAERVSRLSEQGFSYGDVAGGVDIAGEQQLVISDLKGAVSIGNGTDYFSKFRILIVKENENETQDEAAASDSLAQLGIFLNVVDSSELIVSKNNMIATGLFEGLNPNQLSRLQNSDSFGYKINGISLNRMLNVPLGPGEHLTVVTFIDGGFDVSSAVISESAPANRAAPAAVQSVKAASQGVNIYPNPAAAGTINCRVESVTDDAAVSVVAFDLLGREIGVLYSGNVNHGTTTIQDINVSNLPKGINILKVQVGSTITTRQVTIN